jgi:nucleotide-binding universal stress UspA family protein
VGISQPGHATTGRILLAVEAVPQSKTLIATAARRARRAQAEVLVLSVRERDYTRGFVWDIHQPGEIAETVSYAIYELERAGVRARGAIRTARTGRVADEIVYAAHRHHAAEIVIGTSRRSWLGRLLFGSVAPRVLHLSDLPVVAIPTGHFSWPRPGANTVSVRSRDQSDSRGPAPSG